MAAVAQSAHSTALAGDGTTRQKDEITQSSWGKTTSVDSSWNWSQHPADAVAVGTSTIHLMPCPRGVDASGRSTSPYRVLLHDSSRTATALVTGGTCRDAVNAGGTIVISSDEAFSADGYTVGSSTAGIQEAINNACGTDSISSHNGYCHVIIPPSGPISASSNYRTRHFNDGADYNIYATILFQANNSQLDGYGAVFNCYERGACLQLGDLLNSNHFTNETVQGIKFRSPWKSGTSGQYGIYGYGFNGCGISSTRRVSQLVTVDTGTCVHHFRPGDRVTILFTDNSIYWGSAIVTSVPGATSFTYAHRGSDISNQATPGIAFEDYEAIYDNAGNSRLTDLGFDKSFEVGGFNNGIEFQDDENALVNHFNNDGTSLSSGPSIAASYFFSPGNIGVNPPTPAAAVVDIENASITANGGNCYTFLNSNGLYVHNSVCQAQGLWVFYVSNQNGNYQAATLIDDYTEAANLNPIAPPHTPFPGTGVVGGLMGPLASVGEVSIEGQGGVTGLIPSAGAGANSLDYFVVVNDKTLGTHSHPMYAYHWKSTCRPNTSGRGCSNGMDDSPLVYWPRVANGTDEITYTLLRTTLEAPHDHSQGTLVLPHQNACGGGAAATCGAVVVGQKQCEGLVCSYKDNSSVATTSYTFTRASFVPSAINFWPGAGIVMAGGSNTFLNSVIVSDRAIPATAFSKDSPVEIAQTCDTAQPTGGGYIQCLWSVATNNRPNQIALLLPDGGESGGGMYLSKGRLNFTSSPFAAISGHHIVTLQDSTPEATRSTENLRPFADKDDTYIGEDQAGPVLPSAVQLAIGSPVSISMYVRNVGDGSSYKERLTSSLKTFRVPITINSQITSTVQNGIPPFVVDSSTRIANLTTGGNAVIYDCGSEPKCAGRVLRNPIIVKGKIALHSGRATLTSLPFSDASFSCVANDETNGKDIAKIISLSGNTATVDGSGTDAISFVCFGN